MLKLKQREGLVKKQNKKRLVLSQQGMDMSNNNLFELKFTKHPQKSNDEQILQILKQAKIPLPLNFIASIIGLQKDHTYQILVSLEKYDLVKKSTIQRATFYTLKKEGDNENEHIS